ncbi:MAG: cyclic nucleotide-binding/CBS domain-containing protein [Nitrospirae bacterium]|nr:cyclic nucleotide-binding/CBS domain-containing protein [Nitrospirota bacterium]
MAMLSKDAALFLKKHPPFSLLDDHTLGRLVESLIMELYPAGTLILKQGDQQTRGLHIIKEGGVKILARAASGQERVIDYRDAGETFGFLSLDEDDRLDVSVQAVGDTVCYVADKAGIMKLLDDHPLLREYLIPSYFPKREESPAGSSVYQHAPHLGSQRVLFTTPVRDLAGREVITVRADTPIIEAVRLMSAHRISALVIMDKSDWPEGIITSSDLRDRVLARQKDQSDPVSDIMSNPLVMVDGADFCFEALLKMMSHNVHHLLVIDSGKLTGIVSNHDFLVLQGISPLLVVREIENQSTIEGLIAASGKIRGLISLLLREGAGAGSILRIITTVNDRIERKILDLALTTLGTPPVPFCWIVYGSAGRKEQTFKTDQDNAIVYADTAGELEQLATAEYFGRFAEFVVNAFLRCGFMLCPGDFMATTPQWRQPLSVWKRSFSAWIDTPTSKAIHNSANLFDFRGLHGDLNLAVELKKHLMHSLRNQMIFLKALAELTTDYRPPLGLFGSLIFEKTGEHAKHLNIKDKCLTPLTNIVRLFSFESNIPETSTLERIAVLKNIHPVMKEVGDDLEHAFEFVSLLRIRHQLDQSAMNIEPDNFIDPRQLGSLEFRNLKGICSLVAQVINDISRKYGTGARL